MKYERNQIINNNSSTYDKLEHTMEFISPGRMKYAYDKLEHCIEFSTLNNNNMNEIVNNNTKDTTNNDNNKKSKKSVKSFNEDSNIPKSIYFLLGNENISDFYLLIYIFILSYYIIYFLDSTINKIISDILYQSYMEQSLTPHKLMKYGNSKLKYNNNEDDGENNLEIMKNQIYTSSILKKV
jgi:hypothetical protein